jgi:hypothetical protein
MRNKKLFVAALCVFIFLTVIILIFRLIPGKKQVVLNKDAVVIDTIIITPPPLRESITFILGEDHGKSNPYYREATDYYRLNRESRTEYMVTNCRSLIEVRDWLYNHPPQNRRPWGLINLVSHGSQWLGINIPVVPGSKIVNNERLMKFIRNGSFKPLPDSLIDRETEIFIHGCGVGNNKALLKAIALAFGGKEIRPLVRASKLFEFYTSTKNNGRPITCQRFLANAWFVFYKTGQQPDNSKIISDLKKIYPHERINWEDALKRNYPRWPGDLYHHTFEIPLTCVLKYNKHDSLPDLSTEDKKLKWLTNQPEISDFIKMVNIPANRFNWLITNISYLNEKKEKQPAIWVKGNCTILCLLKPLVIESTLRDNLVLPTLHSVEDTFYYSKEQ